MSPEQEKLEQISRLLGGGTPLSNLPQPQFSQLPFRTGNQPLDMMLGHLVMGLQGPGKFLPQQFPAQNMLDSMVAQKYQDSMRRNATAMRAIDTDTIYDRLVGVRSRFDQTPLTAGGAAELRNFAGYMTSQPAQALFSAVMGPQAMEDIFFGRRGSAEMLGNAVSGIGFSRTDAVTGQRRMSADSLEAFSKQLYSNLYGPGADLNDISGFSAGRVGTIMTDLSRRGLLPTSINNLTAAERAREIQSGPLAKELDRLGSTDVKKGGLPAEIVKAFKENKTLDEIEKLPGGADAIRKVDATRVSNSLKEYSKAISTVREIFGDNGITNAPMGQLMAAMEALTQNSMSAMGPGQLDNLMRRTQMAAKDSGVSLEGLLGLTARAGAQADMYGLPRELVGDSVVTAMERGRALRDTGGFAPGFGRVDPDKAALMMQDQNVRANSSLSAQYLAVGRRILAEGTASGDTKQLKSLLDAISRGDTTFVGADGKTVDIYKELGTQPDAFLKPMFAAAGINAKQFSALFNDPNTKEFARDPGQQLHLAQAHEIKSKVAGYLNATEDFVNATAGSGLDEAARRSLARQLSASFADASISQVSTQMTPEERMKTLRSSMRSSFMDQVIAANPALANNYEAAVTAADALMVKTFGGEANLLQTIQRNYANVGNMVINEPTINETLPHLQQTFGARMLREGVRNKKYNLERANMFASGALRGDGSEFLQRLGDAVVNGKGSFIENVFGVVDRADVVEHMRQQLDPKTVERFDSVMGGDFVKEYASAYIDTGEEKNAFIDKIAGADQKTFIEETSKFTNVDYAENAAAKAAFLGKTGVMTDAEVATHLMTKLAGKPDDKGETHGDTRLIKAVKEQFGDDFEYTDADQVMALAQHPELRARGIDFGLDDTKLTRAEARNAVYNARGYAYADTPNGRALEARLEAGSRFIAGLNSGVIDSKDIFSYLELDGSTKKGAAAISAFDDYINNSGDKDAAIKAATDAGISGDKITDLSALADVAHTIRREGGLREFGGATATRSMRHGKTMAGIQKELERGESGLFKADSEIAKLSAKKYADLTEDEKKKLEDDAFVRENMSAVGGKYHVGGKEYTSKEDALKAFRANTSTDLQAAPGGDALSQIGSGISDALKQAFAGEVKINTAVIANLKFSDLGAQTASTATAPGQGISSATVSPAMISEASRQISGTVRIAGDLRTAIINIVRAEIPEVHQPPDLGGPITT